MAVKLSVLTGVRHLKCEFSTQSPQQTCKQRLNWAMLVSNDLCGEFFLFCLPSICCFTHLWGSRATSTSHPCLRYGFWVCGKFSSFTTPSLRLRSLFQVLSLFLNWHQSSWHLLDSSKEKEGLPCKYMLKFQLYYNTAVSRKLQMG